MTKYLKSVKRFKPPDALDSIKNYINADGSIAIYHGGRIFKRADLIPSWTLSVDVAIWFAKRFLVLFGNTVLYRGVIQSDDVIAYTNERNEQEIIQYKSVKNIEVINEFKKVELENRGNEDEDE
jgi:hypothetical protein